MNNERNLKNNSKVDEYLMCIGKSNKKANDVIIKYMPANDAIYKIAVNQ